MRVRFSCLTAFNLHAERGRECVTTSTATQSQQICLTNNSNNVNKSAPIDFETTFCRFAKHSPTRVTTYNIFVQHIAREIAKWSSHCLHNNKKYETNFFADALRPPKNLFGSMKSSFSCPIHKFFSSIRIRRKKSLKYSTEYLTSKPNQRQADKK